MVYNFLVKKLKAMQLAWQKESAVKNENISNKELVKELQKPTIRRFEERKVNSPFIENISGANLVDVQFQSKFNKGICFLLCVIDIFSKYTWVIPLKGKKCITVNNTFQKILKESNRKSNKIWVDKGSECFNRSMKSCLEKNDIKMYSTHSERNSVVAERLISTLKNKIYEYIYKYITNKIKFSVSKNVYIYKLDDIVNKHNNTYHKIIKMKSVDVKSST